MVQILGLMLLFVCWMVPLFGQHSYIMPIEEQSEKLSIAINKPLKPKLNLFAIDSFSTTKPASLLLFKTMPNSYKPQNRLPVFCEIEHQLSKLIKRRVKLGVP